MKLELFTLLILPIFVQCRLNLNEFFNDDDDDQVLIPRPNGSFYATEKDKIKRMIELFSRKRKPVRVKLYLYTRKNPTIGQDVKFLKLTSSTESNFNPNHPTRILVHGWTGDQNSLKPIKDAYLKHKNINIIMVDWSSTAKNPNYIYSRTKINHVAKEILKFILLLKRKLNMNLEILKLIGHSLGAHIVGLAAKNLQKHQLRLQSIIGLDPASSLFSDHNPDKRLDQNDADYVETIHTNTKALGFSKPLGHVSFYPNYGNEQPGCSLSKIFTHKCSHDRAIKLYAESLNDDNKFVPIQCRNYLEILLKRCNGEMMHFKMGGEELNHKREIKGIFYLPTNEREPYGIGTNFFKNN